MLALFPIRPHQTSNAAMSTRSKRARRPVKQQDDEYVDLDSDEFENALEGRDVTPQRKRQKPPEPAEAVAAPAAAAAATADAVEQDEEEVPDEDDMEVVGDDEELEEVVEVCFAGPVVVTSLSSMQKMVHTSHIHHVVATS